MHYPHKYPSTKHWYSSKSVQRDDSFHDVPEFFVGKKVLITEKIDGSNTCLFNGDVYARSVQSPSHDGWMSMIRKHHAHKSLSMENIMIYGEDIYGQHSIEYDSINESDTFSVFAIRDGDTFLGWNDVLFFCNELNLNHVPELFIGTFNSKEDISKFFDENISKPSLLGPEKEGFVMRIYDKFNANEFSKHVTKFVRENHVQQNSDHWRKNWQPAKLIKT